MLHAAAVHLGYLLSAFSWAYGVGQLPGGVLLDGFGARRVYTTSVAPRTLVTFGVSVVSTRPRSGASARS